MKPDDMNGWRGPARPKHSQQRAEEAVVCHARGIHHHRDQWHDRSDPDHFEYRDDDRQADNAEKTKAKLR